MPNFPTWGRLNEWNIVPEFTAVIYKVGAMHFVESYIGAQLLLPNASFAVVLQAALDYMTSGGKLVIRAGTYVCSAACTTTNSNIEIIGEGDSTIIQVSGNITPLKFGNGTYQGGTGTQVTDIILRDFTIDCNGSHGTDVYGIWLHTVSDFRIHNLHVYNQTQANERSGGIITDYCVGGVIDSCHVHDTINGIAVRIGSKDVTISNNHCHDTLTYDGITTFQSDGSHSVIGNHCHDCADNGILIDGGASGANPDTTVTGNVSHDNVHEGIESYQSNRTVISGNTSYSNGREGIYFNAAGNVSFVCSGNESYANAGSGIKVYETRYGTITGNLCRENTLHGIYLLTSANYNSVSGNTCYLNQQNGIQLDQSNYCAFAGNSIQDNSQQTNNTYDEVLLTGTSTHNSFTGNTIRGNASTKARYSINEASSADDSNLYSANNVNGEASTPLIKLNGVSSVAIHNTDYNAVGLIGNPWPASGTDLTNEISGGNAAPATATVYRVRQTPKCIIIKGGTVTDIKIDGSSTGLIAGVFTLGVSQTIEVTHTGAPTTATIRGE